MADPNPPLVGLTDHPRAAHSIRRIKAWGGLAGFAAVVAYGYTSGMPLPDALLRGIIAGVAAQMLAWVAAVVLWQHLLDGEATAAVKAAREKRIRDLERAAAARASSGPSA
jgi:hypothetical protein